MNPDTILSAADLNQLHHATSTARRLLRLDPLEYAMERRMLPVAPPSESESPPVAARGIFLAFNEAARRTPLSPLLSPSDLPPCPIVSLF